MKFKMLNKESYFLPTLCVALALFACGKKPDRHGDKDHGKPRLTLVQDCGETLKDGESRTLTVYAKEFPAFGEKCEAIETVESCTAGQLSLKDPGTVSCEETTLASMKFVNAPASLEIGKPYALTLEGTDQRGGVFKIESSKAKWSTSNDFVSVSTTGVANASLALKDVVITAKIAKLTAQIRLNATGKSCEDTADSATRIFKRFKAERVAFGSSCQAVDVEARCSNGEFLFPEGSVESCDVAKLARLEAAPTALFLNPGETAAVDLFLYDDIGTKMPVLPADAAWELPANGSVLVSFGRVTLRDPVESNVSVNISAQGMTTTLFINNKSAIPSLSSFRSNNVMLKLNDEKQLELNATQPIDPKQINWSSSNPSAVSVTNGSVKALKADSEALITATLNNKSIQTLVRVEAALELTLTPVSYTGLVVDRVQPLTQDKTSLLPAYIADVKGLSTGEAPEFTSVTEGCLFTTNFSRDTWEINVELDDSLDTVPSHCAGQMNLKTMAGQSLVQAISIPVDYNKITVTESQPIASAEGFEVARINLKMSASYTVSSADVKALDNKRLHLDACEWTLAPVDTGYRLLVAKDLVNTCAVQLVFKMLDANDGLVLTTNEFVVASKAKPFEQICQESTSGAAKATVTAVRQEVGPSLNCQKVSALLRSRSLAALTQKKTFALALDNKDLTDLSPLSRLIGLTELSLAANRRLKDLSTLSDLTSLKLLNLKFTAAKDFSPLFNHDALNDLRLPAGAKVSCSDEMSSPELLKICQ
jgi:hypothetical protein